jgi:hypothetical protein
MISRTRLMVLTAIGILRAVSTGSVPDSLMRVSVERDAIFTPGQVRVAVRLTDRAEIAGAYEARLTAFLAGIAVRDLTASISRESPAIFDVPFPRVFARSAVRCRVELSLGGEFLEAAERPVFIWPPVAQWDKPKRPPSVWVLDASGGLQRVFREMDVNAVDAAFQGVRDFASPSVVFVGEFSQTSAVQLIITRLSSMSKQPMVVFLRQKQFPRDLEIETVNDTNTPRSIACDMNSPLLKNLMRVDMLSLLSQAATIETKAKGGFTRSLVAERASKGEPRGVYLCTLDADDRRYVFCQLPVTDPRDPRQTTLLHSLIEFAAGRGE